MAAEIKFATQAEARTYVYGVMAAMLENEFNEPDFHEGWMFGGVENASDRRHLAKALRAVIREMLRKRERRTKGTKLI